MIQNHSKTLIHTAFILEARFLIQSLKLTQNKQCPKIYENESYVLIISGMGKANTQEELKKVFENYAVYKAINIGIAGCIDKTIALGTLFCTTHHLKDIPHTTLTTKDKPLEDKNELSTTLVDMEAKYFYEISTQHLKSEDIYIFKVVSDYLSIEIPKKEFVLTIMQNALKKLKGIV